MKTTLYNHYKAGGDLPLIPNAVFKALIELAKCKDFEECNYIESFYSLIPDQKKFLEWIKTQYKDEKH